MQDETKGRKEAREIKGQKGHALPVLHEARRVVLSSQSEGLLCTGRLSTKSTPLNPENSSHPMDMGRSPITPAQAVTPALQAYILLVR
jgi:hypothetical protein